MKMRRASTLKRLALAIGAGAALCMTAATATDDYNLPALGQPADAVLSPAQAAQAGRRAVAELLARGAIVEDPELTAYINGVGDRLARHTTRPVSDFQFYVIADNGVNAFALPGGYIGVNTGLITITDNESQLAAVMAHEITHVVQHHIARQLEETKGLSVTTAAAMLLAILVSGGNPAVVQAAVALGAAHIGDTQITYTRAHEHEADRIGITTLAAADYDPDAMAGFFKKLQQQARLYGNALPEILLTHPIDSTRIAEAQARAAQLHPDHIYESPAYPFMRARARVLESNQPSEVVNYFQRKENSNDTSPANEYGYALALLRVGRISRAVALLRHLDNKHEGQPYTALALSRAQLATNDNKAGLQTLEAIRSDYANYRPMILAYGNALIANNQARKARNYLLDQTDYLGNDSVLHDELARASHALGDDTEALYQEAESHRLRGEYAIAIHQLRSALHRPDLSSQNKARLRAALVQFQSGCRQALSKSECRERTEGRRGESY